MSTMWVSKRTSYYKLFGTMAARVSDRTKTGFDVVIFNKNIHEKYSTGPMSRMILLIAWVLLKSVQQKIYTST